MTPIIVDSAAGIVVILSVVIAFFRGFMREALTIVNLVGSAAGAYFLGPMMAPSFQKWLGAGENADRSKDIWGFIPPEVAGTFLSYVVGFFGVFLVLFLAGLSITSTLKAAGFGPLDRFLGMMFGLLRGFLIVFLFYLPFGYFLKPAQLPEWAQKSISVPFLEKTFIWMQERLADKNEQDPKETLPPADTLEGKLQRMKEGLTKGSESGKTTDLLPDESRISP